MESTATLQISAIIGCTVLTVVSAGGMNREQWSLKFVLGGEGVGLSGCVDAWVGDRSLTMMEP